MVKAVSWALRGSIQVSCVDAPRNPITQGASRDRGGGGSERWYISVSNGWRAGGGEVHLACGFGARSRVQCFKWVPPGGGDRGAGGGSAVHWCGSAVYGRTDSDDEPSNEWEPVVVVCVRTTACACTSHWPLNSKCAFTVTSTSGHYTPSNCTTYLGPSAEHIYFQEIPGNCQPVTRGWSCLTGTAS